MFKDWGVVVTANNLTEKSKEAKLQSQGGLRLGMQVHALERGQMVWSLLPGLFSQTSWPRWLTFGAWVTHPCFSLDPETITEPQRSSNRHCIITCGSTMHRWHSVPLCMSLAHLSQSFYFKGNSFLSINRSDVSVNSTNGSVGRCCSNYCTFVRLLISVFHLQSSLWDKLYSVVLCSLSLSEVIKSHLNVMRERERLDSSDIFHSSSTSLSVWAEKQKSNEAFKIKIWNIL